MHNNVLLHEPARALFVSDDDPLVFYKKIIALSKRHLKSGGKMYLEINEAFGQEIIELCKNQSFSFMRLIQDINGKDRIVKAIR